MRARAAGRGVVVGHGGETTSARPYFVQIVRSVA
jgi:hypothetical protein